MAHKAASLGHAEILMLLLERTGAKPDLVNGQLSTPLHLACKNNRESVAKFLIGCGVDINGQDEHGQTPLLICCIHGNYELAQLIIEASTAGHTPELLEIDMRDHRGLTPLNCAAIKGDLRLAKLLIEKAQASVEVASPKGCTPVIYAARGGYDEFLQYLIIQCKASPLKQDNSGATLFHHAIEKAQLNILTACLRFGSDFISAIEIADNAGRTPLFEAVDNNAPAELVRLLLAKRSKKLAEGGFGMNANVLSYSGQSPLFSCVREGNMELIRVLIEFGGADPDLHNGEIIKDDAAEENLDEYESVEEKNFMDAYKNCMTPLHLACILGQEDIAMYLIERAQSNPNLQTCIKGYACLHLAVLANKPEMLIELLTRSNANPQLPDYSGQTFIELVETYIPSYCSHFAALIENLSVERLKRTDIDSNAQPIIITHYYNPEDEREIKGFKDPIKDLEKQIEEQLQNQDPGQTTEPEDGGVAISGQGEIKQAVTQKRFLDMEDSEIEVEEGKTYEKELESVFGRKIALSLISVNFKFKEMGLKMIVKHAEKLLALGSVNDININEFVKACSIAIDLTCKEKVIKVFNLSLQLLTLLITSPKVEQSSLAIETFKRTFTERSITLKLLQRSEEGNTRLTNKIHECLLDYSFHPRIGEAHVSSFILQRINSHNKTPTAQKPPLAPLEQSRNPPQEGALGSYKGLLAQLALLYKFVNSFGVEAKKRGPLNVTDIVNAILPSLSHPSQDVRSASTKILLDVQRLSGAVKEERLASIPEKHRNAIIEKLRAQVIQREQNQAMMNGASNYIMVNGGGDESMPEDNTETTVRQVVQSNLEEGDSEGASANWTGSKDQSLKSLLDALNSHSSKSAFNEEFLQNSTVLLKSCLEDNNMNMYLQALEVAQVLFTKCLFTEVVLGSLASLIRPIILRTNETNTRMRKKSVEIINQVWSQNPPQQQVQSKGGDSGNQHNNVPKIIADVICDASLQERAIIGRLGLFIKRASILDGVSADDELSKKPHQVIMGRNYEQLTEFACLWCAHKNTKVRQNALKLIVEICRVNSIDQRGLPFKQRIINMILQLRASLRDPLVAKINEVCSNNGQQYIDTNELELNLATSKQGSNKRAQSLDVRVRNNTRPSSKGTALPEIGGAASLVPRNSVSNEGMLPSVGGGGDQISLSAVNQAIQLPHSEPLNEDQKSKAASLIDLFGLELVTCFYSQFWSNRFAAIEKVEEQLHNLDPNRRDAMSCEINRKNLPIEESFKTFLEFIDEGSRDPVLKNLIGVVDLLKKALPTFFRYIQPPTIRKELLPLVASMIKKTTDLKAKVREVIVELCLYLSHQSVIGPEIMVNQVLSEVEQVLSDASTSGTSNVAANMGNSHMISSCFKLLNSFQQQSKILDKTLKTFPNQQQFYTRFIAIINASLRHSNPTVRKEGETLFKTLYGEFGEKLDSLLVNQKAQLVSKLIAEAKQENGMADGEKQQEINVQRAQSMIRTELLTQSTLGSILKGQEEHFQALKLPNAKKRLNAVVELRKAIQKQLVTVQGNPTTAKAVFEPISMLIRQLLADEEPDIYMETLGMLRAVVGALVPHISTLDVHLMLGSFIGVIVANTVSGNIRTQIASDKVIIFFAKHSNIGPFVVAKDILKNIEKCIKAVQVVTKKDEQSELIQEKKPTVLRFLSILQLLLQHFSIILCYQSEFYDKCIEIVADSLVILAQDDQGIRNLCIQIVVNLQKIDVKLLEQAISKMDFSRKTPLRKAIIELEHQSRAGKNVLTQDHHAFANSISQANSQQQSSNMVPASPMATLGNNKETRWSNMTASSRTSLFSPGTTLRGASPGGPNLGATSNDWGRKSIEGGFTPSHKQQPYIPSGLMSSTQGSQNGGFKPNEGRAMRRMISLENENPRVSQTFVNQPDGTSILQQQARQSVKLFIEDGFGSVTPGSQAKKDLVLPEIVAPISTLQPLASTTNTNNNRPANVQSMGPAAPKMSIHATGGAGFSSGAGAPILKAQTSNDSSNNNNNGGGGGIRPPLYVPQKRDAGRSGTGMLAGNGLQGAGLPTTGQPVSLLNRTGPLPSNYVPPIETGVGSNGFSSANTAGAGAPQFKTEFNSNLYSGLPSSTNSSTSGTSSNMGIRSSSLQKKQGVAAIGGSNLFKGVPPPAAVATFETNVTRYKETTTTPTGTGKNVLGEEQFF